MRINEVLHNTVVKVPDYDVSEKSIRERLCWVVKQDRACKKTFLEAVKIPKAQHKESITVIMEPHPNKLDIDFHHFTMLGLQDLAKRNGIQYYIKSTKEELVALLNEYNERGELHL